MGMALTKVESRRDGAFGDQAFGGCQPSQNKTLPAQELHSIRIHACTCVRPHAVEVSVYILYSCSHVFQWNTDGARLYWYAAYMPLAFAVAPPVVYMFVYMMYTLSSRYAYMYACRHLCLFVIFNSMIVIILLLSSRN